MLLSSRTGHKWLVYSRATSYNCWQEETQTPIDIRKNRLKDSVDLQIALGVLSDP